MRKILIVLVALFFSFWGHAVLQSEANTKPIGQLASLYPDIVFVKGSPVNNQIALTFDDGPDNNITPKILDILKEKQVKATFFVIGINVKDYPQTLKRIYQEGHCIGNHSWSHSNQYDWDTLLRDIMETEESIRQVTGQEQYTKLFRPPYGIIKEVHVPALNNLGFHVIGWNSDSKDWQGISEQKIITNILKDSAPGTIVLQHSFSNDKLLSTVKALPKVIDRLQQNGYNFVTIPELLSSSGQIIVRINNENVNFLSANCWPKIENNTTLTPLRATFEKLGAQITWDGEQKVISIKKNAKNITLSIGSNTAYINNKQVWLDTPPQIDPRSNQTLVPLRFISKSLGAFLDCKVTGRQMVINIVTNPTDNLSLLYKTILTLS